MIKFSFTRGSDGEMNKIVISDPTLRRSGKRIYWEFYQGRVVAPLRIGHRSFKRWYGPMWRFWRGECPTFTWGLSYVALLVCVTSHWSTANCSGCGVTHPRYSDRIELTRVS